MNNTKRSNRRETKAPRFNVYANVCDGRGTARQNDQPLLERSVAPLVRSLAGRASKEPLVVRA